MRSATDGIREVIRRRQHPGIHVVNERRRAVRRQSLLRVRVGEGVLRPTALVEHRVHDEVGTQRGDLPGAAFFAIFVLVDHVPEHAALVQVAAEHQGAPAALGRPAIRRDVHDRLQLRVIV